MTDESGRFEIHVADGSYKSLSTIYVEVIDPQIPSSVVFDDAPPDLKNAAGTILKEEKSGSTYTLEILILILLTGLFRAVSACRLRIRTIPVRRSIQVHR
ncbi:hypothetical protein ACKZDW_04945 (plasmid) [Ralstonia syzygii subsp. celebesensis]